MKCKCVSKHLPLPLVTYNIKVSDEEIELCPSSFFNLKELLSHYSVENSIPPGAVTKHYSKYVRNLAHDLWVDNNLSP